MVIPSMLSLLPLTFKSYKLKTCPPVGQASYNSTITLHVEDLPVSVDILGNLSPSPPRRKRAEEGMEADPFPVAKNCDLLIFNLVQALVGEGIVGVSLPGRTIEGGEVLMRRGGRVMG